MTQPPAFFDPAPAGAPGASADPRMKFSQACQRNRAPILAVLQRVLPKGSLMVEIGAGTGQHAAYFAPHFPDLDWQPTEVDVSMHGSIAAWAEASREKTGAANIRPPMALDVTADPWPVERADAVLSANMIHIAPWECCLGLMAGAGRVLTRGGDGRSPDRDKIRGGDGGTPDRDKIRDGALALYGPFKQDGRHTADSNASFDDSLRSRDAAWGIRDLEAVIDSAAAQGLAHEETITMPANNLMLIFRR